MRERQQAVIRMTTRQVDDGVVGAALSGHATTARRCKFFLRHGRSIHNRQSGVNMVDDSVSTVAQFPVSMPNAPLSLMPDALGAFSEQPA